MGHLWERLFSTLRHLRLRVGDACWAAAQPPLSKLHAGFWRLNRWRRRRADALWFAGASLRLSWQQATGRRRATVGALAVLPFVMASGLTAALLPDGGDPQALPSGVKLPRDAGADATSAKSEGAVKGARAVGRKPARSSDTGSSRPGAASPVAAAAPTATATPAPGKARSRGSDRVESDYGGSSPSISPDVGQGGTDRRTGPSPDPAPRAPSRSAPTDGERRRPVSNPGRPPATTPTPPPAAAPAPPPPPPPPPPPTLQQAPQVAEPNGDYDEDSDSGRSGGSGNGQGNGPPGDRGGGNDDDDDEDRP